MRDDLAKDASQPEEQGCDAANGCGTQGQGCSCTAAGTRTSSPSVVTQIPDVTSTHTDEPSSQPARERDARILSPGLSARILVGGGLALLLLAVLPFIFRGGDENRSASHEDSGFELKPPAPDAPAAPKWEGAAHSGPSSGLAGPGSPSAPGMGREGPARSQGYGETGRYPSTAEAGIPPRYPNTADYRRVEADDVTATRPFAEIAPPPFRDEGASQELSDRGSRTAADLDRRTYRTPERGDPDPRAVGSDYRHADSRGEARSARSYEPYRRDYSSAPRYDDPNARYGPGANVQPDARASYDAYGQDDRHDDYSDRRDRYATDYARSYDPASYRRYDPNAYWRQDPNACQAPAQSHYEADRRSHDSGYRRAAPDYRSPDYRSPDYRSDPQSTYPAGYEGRYAGEPDDSYYGAAGQRLADQRGVVRPRRGYSPESDRAGVARFTGTIEKPTVRSSHDGARSGIY